MAEYILHVSGGTLKPNYCYVWKHESLEGADAAAALLCRENPEATVIVAQSLAEFSMKPFREPKVTEEVEK